MLYLFKFELYLDIQFSSNKSSEFSVFMKETGYFNLISKIANKSLQSTFSLNNEIIQNKNQQTLKVRYKQYI